MSGTPQRILSDRELDEVYKDAVRPLLAKPTQENPRLLILGGPQGSGKSTTLPVVERQLGMTQAVRLDGDDIMALHPHFEGIARGRGGLEAARRVGPDYSVVVARMLRDVRMSRQDLILIGPYTHMEATLQRIAPFRETGYRVGMAYMAVHPAVSQLGVVHRHHQAMRDGIGYSLLIPLELQQRVFENTPTILERAQTLGVTDAVHVVDRTGIVASTERQADGTWRPALDIPDVVHATRMRPWEPDVREAFRRRRADVEQTTGEQWRERLSSIDALAAPMLRGFQPSSPDHEAVAAARLAAISFGHSASAATGRSDSASGVASGSGSRETGRSPSPGPER